MILAVVDPLPMYRQGVAAVLSAAGYTVEAPDDVLEWARENPDGLLLLTLATDADWKLLTRLAGDTAQHRVVALLAGDVLTTGARAVRAGAQSVLVRDIGADVLRRAVAATLDGQAVLPAAVAGTLAAGSTAGPGTPAPLPAEQFTWLEHLAAGMTVAELARLVGYSERAMYRLLQGLYRKLGTETRIEAIVYAQRQGWLRLGTSPPGP